MTEENTAENKKTENEKGINVEIDEDNTTRVENDAFENAELKFPCEFPISIMGLNVPEYEETVTNILKKHVPWVNKNDIQKAFSSNEKYCSIKASFLAVSRDQLDELYKELTANELVKWVL